MEKKQYIIPSLEVSTMQAAIGIMKTSIGMEGSNLPGEPGTSGSGAPRRRSEVF